MRMLVSCLGVGLAVMVAWGLACWIASCSMACWSLSAFIRGAVAGKSGSEKWCDPAVCVCASTEGADGGFNTAGGNGKQIHVTNLQN